jgi:diaminopimelate epimerase
MIPFEKYHGTGNDFAVVDAAHHVPDRGRFAERACNPARGVGADGVLFCHLEREFRPPRVVMTLVQPDGSTAAMCGNGARCVAAWAAGRTGADEVMIDTPAGTRRAVVPALPGTDGETGAVAVEMERPSFDPGDVPLADDEPLVEANLGGYEVTAVDTGVPHAVAFVDDVADVDVADDAPAIRHHDAFPEGANVTFASRDGDGFAQRTFERGVEGETDACGTGAVAVAAVARRLGLAAGDVRVSPPGGDLRVSFDDRGRATLRGPVVREFDGELETPPARRLDA